MIVDAACVVAGLVTLLQVALSARRDLGPLTVGVCGAVLALCDGEPHLAQVHAVATVSVCCGLAALAWARGSRHAVGHLALDGTALAGAVAAAAIPWSVPDVMGGMPVLYVGPALAIGSTTLGTLLMLAALDRPGPRMARPRWYRVVPIE